MLFLWGDDAGYGLLRTNSTLSQDGNSLMEIAEVTDFVGGVLREQLDGSLCVAVGTISLSGLTDSWHAQMVSGI